MNTPTRVVDDVGHAVSTTDLTKRFGSTTALAHTSLTLRPGVITGLVGPNGAGKSTLLRILGARIRPTSGTFAVGGGDPWHDDAIARSTCLVGDGAEVWEGARATKSLAMHEAQRPAWDDDLAASFLQSAGVNPAKKPAKLSLGQRSSLAAAIGLASRAALTMFDEVTVGMDAGVRARFHRTLLTDYAEHPRTVVLSSHLIQELEHVVEDLVVLRDSDVVYSGPTAGVTDMVLALTGPEQATVTAASGANVLSRQQIGQSTRLIIMVDAESRDLIAQRAHQEKVRVEPLSLQDAVIHLTSTTEGETP